MGWEGAYYCRLTLLPGCLFIFLFYFGNSVFSRGYYTGLRMKFEPWNEHQLVSAMSNP